MISSVSHEFHCPSCCLINSLQKSIEKISDIARQSIWIPISQGVSVGVCGLGFSIFIQGALSFIPAIDTIFADPAIAAEYLEGCAASFWDTAVAAPFWEEVIFRGVIQDALKFLAHKIVPDQDIEIFSYKMKLGTLVAIVATATLFGWAHLGSGLGIMHVILATVAGVAYGLLKEKQGLAASISAHMTNNAIVYGLGVV